MTVPPRLTPDEPMRLQAVRDLKLMETPLQERFERITRLAKRLLNVDIAAVSLVGADRQYFASIQGLAVCETSRDVSFCGHTILGTELMCVPDARQDARFAKNPLVEGPPNIVFYAAVPLRSEDGFNVGSLCVIDSEPREPSPDELQCLRDLAALAEVELQATSANAVQAELLESTNEAQRRAMVDELTRVWNRAGLYRQTDELLANTAAGGEATALIMVDLDGFKPVNDDYGHMVGDELLRQVAKRLLASVRETDIVGRWGGDEFLVIISPCESPAVAERMVERIRERLSSSPIDMDAGWFMVEASIGMHYCAQGESTTVDDLINEADARMYEHKRQGQGETDGGRRSRRVA